MSGLAGAPIGCVPIVWNNVDLPDLAPAAPYDVVLEEMARIGFAGCQFGRGFAEGAVLRSELKRRGLRLAELYCALPADADGLVGEAEAMAREALDRLLAADGEMLVVALDGGGGRDEWAGRVAEGAPRWPDVAFDRLAALLADVADAAPDGARLSFHPHAATWIEAPDEVEALASRLSGTRAGLCLDVGHYTVGGGDAVQAVARHGGLITHVHVKDVDPAVLARVRAGEIRGFGAAVRERIFTELGNGVLDLDGVVRALDAIDYGGWLMVEQDSSWLPPAEAAEIGLRALRSAMAGVAR